MIPMSEDDGEEYIKILDYIQSNNIPHFLDCGFAPNKHQKYKMVIDSNVYISDGNFIKIKRTLSRRIDNLNKIGNSHSWITFGFHTMNAFDGSVKEIVLNVSSCDNKEDVHSYMISIIVPLLTKIFQQHNYRKNL